MATVAANRIHRMSVELNSLESGPGSKEPPRPLIAYQIRYPEPDRLRSSYFFGKYELLCLIIHLSTPLPRATRRIELQWTAVPEQARMQGSKPNIRDIFLSNPIFDARSKRGLPPNYPMTETETMAREMNQLMRLLGDEELSIPEPDESTSELEFLKALKQQYTGRLLQKVPKYQALKSEALIPDMFLDALRRREAELEAGQV
jgi:hypothetical protein